MSIISFTNLTWMDVEKLDHSKTILILPVGSIEQHGPHLPLDTDTLIGLYLTDRLVETNKGFNLIILPPLRYTYSKPSAVFPGTVSIRGETLIKLTQDITSSFIEQKFEKLLIMNSHYENTDFLIEGLSLCPGDKNSIKIILANWWELIDEKDLVKIFGPGWKGWVDEHAALVETSLMMYIAPELVKTDKIVDDRRKSRFEFRIFQALIKCLPIRRGNLIKHKRKNQKEAHILKLASNKPNGKQRIHSPSKWVTIHKVVLALPYVFA